VKRRIFIENVGILAGELFLKKQYKDYLDYELSDYLDEIKKGIHRYVVIGKYVGKKTKQKMIWKRQGNGIAYKRNLLTNNHIINLPECFEKEFEEKNKNYKDKFEIYDLFIIGQDNKDNWFEYNIKHRSKDPDIAILKYPTIGDVGPLRMLEIKKIGDSDKIEEGDFVFAIRSPHLIGPIYSEGKIVGKEIPFDIKKIKHEKSYFIHSISTTLGDSGSPIFTLYKEPELVGLMTGIIDAKSDKSFKLQYAVKINEFKKYI